jgi:aryl-alcohol dehydrogenase-like predicted oxidoreductase
LTDRNQESGFAQKLAVLQAEARKLETSIDALVLAACLRRPFVDIVLSGATSVDQLLSNVQACRLKVDDETAARLAELVEPAETYWATRSRLAWN